MGIDLNFTQEIKKETLLRLKGVVLKKVKRYCYEQVASKPLSRLVIAFSGQNVYQHKPSHLPLWGCHMGFHCNYFAINDFNFIHFSNASKIQVKHYVRNTKGANKGCRQNALLLHFASLLPTKENNNLHVQNIKPIRLVPAVKKAS